MKTAPINFKKIHHDILAWYDSEKRDLPWRRSHDPYRIWISEIMLQQTRVEAVLPYYERFLSNFPTVQSLAEAHLDSVLNLWAGLGYYSRARNLHAAAKQVMENFSGKFPTGFEELRSLKGIGPYTAAAIASMAFDQPYCALDGNLERVFARLLALHEDPKTAGKPKVAALGEKLIILGHAGNLNQAFMDLASGICLPREPQCPACPIAKQCKARQQGIQKLLPIKKIKAAPIALKAAAWAVFAGEKLLLARRPAGEWLAGMWDLPWQILADEDVRPSAPFGNVVATCLEARTITKHKIAFEVRALQCRKRPGAKEILRMCANAHELRWVALADLHGINLPRPSEKALEKILPKLN